MWFHLGSWAYKGLAGFLKVPYGDCVGFIGPDRGSDNTRTIPLLSTL